MDLSRFFRPHHSSRLLAIKVRQLEILELEQATTEVLRAVQRAGVRAGKGLTPQLQNNSFDNVVRALEVAQKELALVTDSCNADTESDMLNLVRERSQAPGWERWCQLVMEQLRSSTWFQKAIASESEQHAQRSSKKAA